MNKFKNLKVGALLRYIGDNEYFGRYCIYLGISGANASNLISVFIPNSKRRIWRFELPYTYEIVYSKLN